MEVGGGVDFELLLKQALVIWASVRSSAFPLGLCHRNSLFANLLRKQDACRRVLVEEVVDEAPAGRGDALFALVAEVLGAVEMESRDVGSDHQRSWLAVSLAVPVPAKRGLESMP